MTERFLIADDMLLDEIEEVAYALEWGWVGSKRPPETGNVIHAWQTLFGSTVVYVEDQLLRLRYFVLNGSRAADARGELMRSMRLLSREAVIASVEQASTFEEQSESARRLLAAAGDAFDPQVFALLEKMFLSHPDPRIRTDSIKGLSYVGWPELLPLLERLATNDDNGDVRAFAVQALRAWGAPK